MKFYRLDLQGYMERWICSTPFGEIRLHHILRSDYDRDSHDHPFGFISIIIKGRYTEQLYEANPNGLGARLTKTWTPPRWIPRFVSATQLHKLTLMAPVWTLVFAGPRTREWGFQTNAGWIHHTLYDKADTN